MVPSIVAFFDKSLRLTRSCEPIISLGELCLAGNRAKLAPLHYNNEDFELLRRSHDYSVTIGGKLVELSVQLYLNNSNHYRMFLFSRCDKATGMLFSINLTVSEDSGGLIWLGQKIAFREGRSTDSAVASRIRSTKARIFTDVLLRSGIVVTDNLEVELGMFDGKRKRFLDTNPGDLIRTFITIGVVKGHFSGNKGYQFSCLPRFDDSFNWQRDQTEQVRAQLKPNKRGKKGSRIIPLSLRFQVFDRDPNCTLCGRGAADGVKLHVDHIKPFSTGGLTTLENLQTLCADCNIGKGNRSSTDFR